MTGRGLAVVLLLVVTRLAGAACATQSRKRWRSAWPTPKARALDLSAADAIISASRVGGCRLLGRVRTDLVAARRRQGPGLPALIPDVRESDCALTPGSSGC